MAGLLFLSFAYFAVGQASAKRGDVQGAADAAALGAAQNAGDQSVADLFDDPDDASDWTELLRGRLFASGQACSAAEQFGQKNSADVISCDATVDSRIRFTVKVVGSAPVGDSLIPGTEGIYAEASATAVLTPRCVLVDPDQLNSVPGDPGISLRCAGEELEVDITRGLEFPMRAQDLFTVRLSE